MGSDHNQNELKHLNDDLLESRALKRVMIDSSLDPNDVANSMAGLSSSSSSSAVPTTETAETSQGGDKKGTSKAAITSGTLAPKSPRDPPQVDRLFSDRVVTILVGPHEVKWCLHENLLSSVSDFFRSAFNSGFKESFEDKITLPEDEPQAFELFVRWLYTRTVMPDAISTPALAAGVLTNRQIIMSGPAAYIQDYLRLYVLASKLLIEDLENACVDMAHAFYKVGTRRPDIRDVQYIYENTMPGCGMRRLLKERLTLGLFRGKQNNPVTAEWRDVLNETPDLGFDVVSEISSYHWISGGNAPPRTTQGECSFHRHEKSEVCVV